MEQKTLLHTPLCAGDIVAELNRYYLHAHSYWIGFAELRIGTGYGKDAEQRIDYWAMETIPSKRFRRVAYEIKVSRSDFLAELKKPLKRRRALLLSNEFYFITPPGLIRADELPPECGLAEVGEFGIHFKCVAPWRDTSPPTWQFVAALTRRAAQDAKQEAA